MSEGIGASDAELRRKLAVQGIWREKSRHLPGEVVLSGSMLDEPPDEWCELRFGYAIK